MSLRKDKLKKQLDKEFEELEATGAEGKKGDEDARKIFKEQEKKQAEEDAKTIELLEQNRRSKFSYNVFLAMALKKGLDNMQFPLGWEYKIAPTDIGVVMEIKTDKGRFFRNAFKSTGSGFHDLNAVKMFMVRADNLIDHLPPQKTKGGIFVS
jgi:hypothetical protein